MSWLNRVRNSIPFLPKRESPDNLWHKCRNCNAMIFTKEWEENDFVCPRCDHHGRMGARARLELSTALFGAGQREAAIDELLTLVRRDRAWNEEAGRKQLVKFFEAMGPTDPLTLSARRRLSSILFS